MLIWLSLEKLDHLWSLHQSYLFIMCPNLSSSLQLTTSSSFKKKKKGPTTIFLPLNFKKTSLWWGLLFSERVSESVSLWTRAKRFIPIYIPSMSTKIFLEIFWWHVRIYPNKSIFYHINNNSHVITAMWICHMDTQQQCFCLIKC